MPEIARYRGFTDWIDVDRQRTPERAMKLSIHTVGRTFVEYFGTSGCRELIVTSDSINCS
jgi:hypothetical protein